ncbi:UDP-glucose 4-epimerase GalE [Intestinimonas massiliensis (ex Afouda et al. 2020)]|uniref:UDP-glucose 4-epimerase GalE n=1 Tax=Intestinimonas massiliensis (ex Afouda et al. 2020) TaxID=1673721 RepID=UPI00067ED099|nr:UDP-glucose 4-epimerase GalE [Intestinimonas massiliensis (ex Afouda et al. 2020)]
MKTILVAGGAGYIGSHMVALLVEKGYDVVVADNLCTGHWQAVKGARLRVGDVRDAAFLNRVFTEFDIDGVINFAAYSLVGESVTDPLKYYGNNVAGAQTMLQTMKNHGVDKIVFSSTAATYGEPEKQPIEETDRTDPTNPYGASKLAIEGMLKWCDRAYGIHYAALRYFNAAGSNPDAGIGEDHHPETHLIPIVLQAALGKRSHVGIFGDDYPTPDGTCIRDYIHVRDLVEAHLLALEHLERTGESGVFNLGSGDGFSVKEIVETAQKVTGRAIPAKIEPRRAGDPSVLIASNAKAAQVLGWKPTRGLEQIIADAWAWHQSHPDGYEG